MSQPVCSICDNPIDDEVLIVDGKPACNWCYRVSLEMAQQAIPIGAKVDIVYGKDTRRSTMDEGALTFVIAAIVLSTIFGLAGWKYYRDHTPAPPTPPSSVRP